MSNIVNLSKGVPVSLAKEDGSSVPLTAVHVGAGWDVSREATDVDIDLIFLMLESNKVKKIVTQTDGKAGMVFYNNKVSACGSIVLDKDNRTGEGDGYDENCNLNLETMAEGVGCIAVVVDIFNAVGKGQNFGMVENAYIDVNIPGLPTMHVDLTEDHAGSTTVHIADIYNHNGVWKVKNINLGRSEGFNSMIAEYGVQSSY